MYIINTMKRKLPQNISRHDFVQIIRFNLPSGLGLLALEKVVLDTSSFLSNVVQRTPDSISIFFHFLKVVILMWYFALSPDWVSERGPNRSSSPLEISGLRPER